MELKNVKIVEEIEACKDILWFLKGCTANTEFHINALSDVINELQSRILEDKQGRPASANI